MHEWSDTCYVSDVVCVLLMVHMFLHDNTTPFLMCVVLMVGCRPAGGGCQDPNLRLSSPAFLLATKIARRHHHFKFKNKLCSGMSTLREK